MSPCLGKNCSFCFTVCFFRVNLSLCAWASLPYDFDAGMWDLMVTR